MNQQSLLLTDCRRIGTGVSRCGVISPHPPAPAEANCPGTSRRRSRWQVSLPGLALMHDGVAGWSQYSSTLPRRSIKSIFCKVWQFIDQISTEYLSTKEYLCFMLGLMHFQNIRHDINKAASAVSI